MRAVWTPQASRDREKIYRFIEEDSAEAALRLDDLFSAAVGSLLEFPQRGRSGRMSGSRELVVHPNYIVVYRVSGENIEILAIVHAAQRWP